MSHKERESSLLENHKGENTAVEESMPPSRVGALENFWKNFMTILSVCVRSTYKGRTVSLSSPMAARDASVTGAKIYDKSYALTCSPH